MWEHSLTKECLENGVCLDESKREFLAQNTKKSGQQGLEVNEPGMEVEGRESRGGEVGETRR